MGRTAVMEIKKIGIYPFNSDCMVFLEYAGLLKSEYNSSHQKLWE